MEEKQESRDKKQWAAAAWDMLYLVQCGINSMAPDPERVAGMDLEKVYARSKSQSLEVLTYMALDNLIKTNPQCLIPDPKHVLSNWKEVKTKILAKNLMMDATREQLFAFLEERGIWHVALKGAVLCRMYPKYGMRQMADNDILFDSAFRQEVHDWFVKQGYEVESYQISNHDQYRKKPVYNFEMHVTLFKENDLPQLTQHDLTIKKKLVQKPGTKFEYYMTDEDFYLYTIAHGYKHYFDSGIGLRFLLDLYICNHMNPRMNCKYLEKELKQMGLFEFENTLKKLALKVFSPSASIDLFLENDLEKLKELLFSCTYGTKKEQWTHQIRHMQPNEEKKSLVVKLHYLMRRLFPDKTYMEFWCQKNTPYFLRHRWLIPIAPFWRIIKRGVEKRKQIKEELDVVRKA